MIVRGQQVSVSLRGGETVGGWLSAQSRLGIYVALDRHGNVIRFIPSGAWQSASYAYDDVVTFDDAVDRTYGRPPSREASEMLVRAAEAALARTDFNAARRLYKGLSAQASRFQGWYERLDFEESTERDGQSLGDTAITVRTLYSDLVQQLELSGLDRVLLEHSEEPHSGTGPGPHALTSPAQFTGCSSGRGQEGVVRGKGRAGRLWSRASPPSKNCSCRLDSRRRGPRCSECHRGCLRRNCRRTADAGYRYRRGRSRNRNIRVHWPQCCVRWFEGSRLSH
jgi:hypothetical protein